MRIKPSWLLLTVALALVACHPFEDVSSLNLPEITNDTTGESTEPDWSEPDWSEPDWSEPDGIVPDGIVPDGIEPPNLPPQVTITVAATEPDFILSASISDPDPNETLSYTWTLTGFDDQGQASLLPHEPGTTGTLSGSDFVEYQPSFPIDYFAAISVHIAVTDHAGADAEDSRMLERVPELSFVRVRCGGGDLDAGILGSLQELAQMLIDRPEAEIVAFVHHDKCDGEGELVEFPRPLRLIGGFDDNWGTPQGRTKSKDRFVLINMTGEATTYDISRFEIVGTSVEPVLVVHNATATLDDLALVSEGEADAGLLLLGTADVTASFLYIPADPNNQRVPFTSGAVRIEGEASLTLVHPEIDVPGTALYARGSTLRIDGGSIDGGSSEDGQAAVVLEGMESAQLTGMGIVSDSPIALQIVGESLESPVPACAITAWGTETEQCCNAANFDIALRTVHVVGGLVLDSPTSTFCSDTLTVNASASFGNTANILDARAVLLHNSALRGGTHVHAQTAELQDAPLFHLVNNSLQGDPALRLLLAAPVTLANNVLVAPHTAVDLMVESADTLTDLEFRKNRLLTDKLGSDVCKDGHCVGFNLIGELGLPIDASNLANDEGCSVRTELAVDVTVCPGPGLSDCDRPLLTPNHDALGAARTWIRRCGGSGDSPHPGSPSIGPIELVQ